ncbi:MAG: glycine cleavage system protein GcvH [Lentisphaerae bacterium]|jgi:glycine cleavage system H protein|nr:glycine cleavage system protein GcvH [Lentisphaerota bacterium]MBT4815928.1 glycine cleavage system protein GcvH [Lentisphaerota bacterium]MBT5611598.1 glycine cleavage system protein GcvH [Lentisphaerota bacterium]MBT7061697.1 glycine cleavage system protein GcvH [Lentisphaerota bacterium]MBT7846543.1 glycine cleavage system protein GcvH [Lentisphaerota bacterium]
MKRFSEEHEWVELVEGTATVGITAYAASELGDITFIELPETGVVLGQGEVLCVVESVKAASDVFVPIGGTIVEVNGKLEEEPELLNESAENDAWICRLNEVDASEMEGLMTEREYETFTSSDDDV